MTKLTKKYLNELTYKIIGAAIEVHRELGPGLLESVYEDCMLIELGLQGLKAKRQLSVPINYKGHIVNTELRCDLLVEDCIVVELKDEQYNRLIIEVEDPVAAIDLLTGKWG